MNSFKLIVFVSIMWLVSCAPVLRVPQEFKAPPIRVLLDQLTARDSVVFYGKYTLTSEEAQYEFGPKNKLLYISPFKKGYKLFNENRIFVFQNSDPVRLVAADKNSYIKFQNQNYKGNIVLIGSPDQSVFVINKIAMDDYLRGVVPSEMPSHDPKYLNALKAQAICARTYAFRKMEERRKMIFDVYDDVRDQVYSGTSLSTELSNKAVAFTRGDVLMSNDSLAVIYYHSTCGGILEAAASRFGESRYAHMQQSRDLLGSEFACSASPYFRWNKCFSLEQVDSLFKQKFHRSYINLPPEDTLRVQLTARILERSASGRVQALRLSLGDTSIVLRNFAIRNFFRSSGNKALPSNLFLMRASGDSVLCFDGGGYGHGVGLCQWGALHMSEMGFQYYDILVNKYFRGTYLKKVYE